jgi:hypothetical protein
MMSFTQEIGTKVPLEKIDRVRVAGSLLLWQMFRPRNEQFSWFMATLVGCKARIALWLHNCSIFDEKLEISGFISS